MTLPAANNAEGGTSGTTVTTANSGGSSGTAFDTVTIGGTSTLTFDNAHAAHGTLSYKCVTSSGANDYLQWLASISSQATYYGRLYFYVTANPTANFYLISFMSGATNTARIRLTSTGKLAIIDSLNATIATSTNSVTLNAWNRIEFTFTFSTTVGSGSVSLFPADSTTATETITAAASQNFGAASSDTVRFGVNGAPAAVVTLWMDSIQVNATALPGPDVSGFSITGVTATTTLAAPAGSVGVGVRGVTATMALAAPAGSVSASSGVVSSFAPVIVEIAFANNVNTPLASLTWTDVTRWCQPIGTSQGRLHEGTVRVEAGRLTVRLVNNDGRFSPFNTSSPYYGPYTDGSDSAVMGLVPMKRIRVRAVYNGITYPVWCGYIESYAMVYPNEVTAYCDITAVDGFKVLNLRQLGSVYYETIMADNPATWYRLGDASGSVVVSSTVPGAQTGSTSGMAGVGTGITLGGSALLPFDPNGSATFDTSNPAIIAAAPPLSNFSAECWIRTTWTTASQVLVSQDYYSNTGMWAISIGTNGHLTFNVIIDVGLGTGTSLPNLAPALNDGALHHVAGTYVASTGTSIAYVDGVAIGTATGTVGGAFVGNLMIGATGAAGETGLVGSIADVALYPTALSASRVAAHYAAGASALGGQLTGARVGAVLDWAAWSAADRHIDIGYTPLQATTLTQSALSAINAAEDAGEGLFFIATDGTATFYDRSHAVLNAHSATSQITLGEGVEPYDLLGTAVAEDDFDIWNDIPVTRNGGVAQHSFDLVSQKRYGQRTMPGLTSLAMASDGDALSMSQYLLGRYKDPVMRVSGVMIHPMSDPANLFPKVLGLGLWDRVTVTRIAPGGGTPYSQQALIEKITHTISETGDWHTVWALSPADTTQYWSLQDSVLGILQSTTRLFW